MYGRNLHREMKLQATFDFRVLMGWNSGEIQLKNLQQKLF